MNQNQEFEIVTDKGSNYKIFLNVMKYRNPHLHLDYEIAFVMSGHLQLIYDEGDSYVLSPGDFMCVNPYRIHEFKSEDNVRLLLLQVNPEYFKATYPQIRNLEFTFPCAKNPHYSAQSPAPVQAQPSDISDTEVPFSDEYLTSYYDAFNDIFELAKVYMEQKPDYELKCAGLLNMLFFELLKLIPHTNISREESVFAHNRATRMRRIADYIEQHLEDKIMLSDIAEYEHLTLTYLSHFFKDNFHMSFQEYVSKLRCEKARNLLLTTDLSLLDISISCGFSDPKYFKSGFIKQYGLAPKEYRKDFSKQKLAGQQTSMLTTQQILSRQTSLILLQQYLDQNQITD